MSPFKESWQMLDEFLGDEYAVNIKTGWVRKIWAVVLYPVWTLLVILACCMGSDNG